jgi:hypothetical protein
VKQSRLMSLAESVINILVGFGISLGAQTVFLPLLGVQISFGQNFAFAMIMTVISIARSYLLRRLFEALHIRNPISPFMLAVIAERRRQVEVEGWTAEHDAQHDAGELARAGAAYAIAAGSPDGGEHLGVDRIWPWSVDWWKPTGFRRDLVKACALIAADGERHDGLKKRRGGPQVEPTSEQIGAVR